MPKGRIFKGLVTVLVLLIIIVIVLGAFVFILKRSISTHETTTTEVLQEAFLDIGELAMEEYTVTDQYSSKENKELFKKIKIPLTKRHYMITYNGVVKAGIKDFSGIEVKVNDSKKTITVKLPKTEILDTYIDNSSVQVVDQSFNPFHRYKLKDLSAALAGQEDAIEKRAIEGGVLEKAEENAKELFEAQAKTLAGSDYTVVFK